ncbi:butyrophilin-like protein 1 isoform X2 [Paroedura picta]|uniref:butyrophilin-like protein 1 isoform X2 n=1 Tax=Paroedura picta TaxID=143630 RepID=UPI004056F047
MDVKQCLTLASFCLATLVSNSLSEHFEVSSSPSVVGIVGQDVVLSCQISLGRPPQIMHVQWQKIGHNYENIYEFNSYAGLEIFGRGYESRTALAKEGLPSGNMSLKLKNVRIIDEGSYRCIIRSTGWRADSQTTLHVTGMGMVSIEILGPQGKGLKLACRSSGWFPSPELQWLVEDNQSYPFELEQDHEQLFRVSSSITVLRGTREVTCLVHEKGYPQMKQKATIFLSRDIYPQTSPWLPAFWVLFLLSFLLFGFTGYRIYKAKQKHSLMKHSKEKACLVLESEKKTLKADIHLMRDKIARQQMELERKQTELESQQKEFAKQRKELESQLREFERRQSEFDFKRAQSDLVPIHLDPSYKHFELAVSADCTKVQHKPTSSNATTMAEALIAVGKEGFKKGRQYWQVWVGSKPEWEIGVMTKATRDWLKTKKFEAPPEKGYWSLRKSNGKYYPEEADCQISSHSRKPEMVGVYLDWEEDFLLFYNVNNRSAIMKNPIGTSEKLYPCFSPGHSEVGDNVHPLVICPNRDWDSPSQLGGQIFPFSSSSDENAEPGIADNSQEKNNQIHTEEKKHKFKGITAFQIK